MNKKSIYILILTLVLWVSSLILTAKVSADKVYTDNLNKQNQPNKQTVVALKTNPAPKETIKLDATDPIPPNLKEVNIIPQ